MKREGVISGLGRLHISGRRDCSGPAFAIHQAVARNFQRKRGNDSLKSLTHAQTAESRITLSAVTTFPLLLFQPLPPEFTGRQAYGNTKPV
jgi:hypothetical protein